MKRYDKFSEEEDRMLITMREYGYSYAQITEHFHARGWMRSKPTINHRYNYIMAKRKEQCDE